MDHAVAEAATAWATIATAVASWALAAVTVGVVCAQIREAKRATGLQLFVLLTQDFQSPAMRSLRRAFATELLIARLHEPQRKPLADETVLEFFENLAHLTRDKVLERQIVWNYFSVTVDSYWHASQSFIGSLRVAEGDAELYVDLEWLAKELAAITSKRQQRGYQPPQAERVNDFLRSEQSLT
ncbi:DUF4760 domain-containing protein [Ralstonia insidiosa]|uniref:DUF4760 domain-containing protein n=1 Tax=Ralstonia insidiosa TaxID=190721 RepID=UPI000CEEFE93|nr:hypothetical protein [Ralstonia insidiosa]